MNPIKWLLTKSEPTNKETPVTDTSTITATADPVTVTNVTPVATTETTTTTVKSDDRVLVKVKDLLITLGHDVEDEFDEIVALAKKLVAKSS